VRFEGTVRRRTAALGSAGTAHPPLAGECPASVPEPLPRADTGRILPAEPHPWSGRAMHFPAPQPVLWGERLLLRPFTPDDAPTVLALAGAVEIASSTLNIPHPYRQGMAEEWIGSHAPRYAAGELASFAVAQAEDGVLVGTIGLATLPAHRRAELGYWIGVPYWNRGFASEAAHLILDFGFRSMGLNRVVAHHLVRNPASGAVMRKAGMRYEGRLRQHVLKWGRFEDIDVYGILAEEWRPVEGSDASADPAGAGLDSPGPGADR
jgi:[ribosomal protein S5]-alanine N-acetyltransferase